MDTSSGTPAIGTALVVYGSVKVESTDGVTKTIQPNEQIKLADRVDTGQDGSITVVFNNDADNLELGRMTDMVIDQDVFQAGDDLDLANVTVAPELLQDILQGWDVFEPVPSPESMLPETDVASDSADAADSDALMAAPEKIDLAENGVDVVSTESGDGDMGAGDDDLDLSNLIPPPDDVS